MVISMNNLPTGWSKEKLGKMVSHKKGKKPKSLVSNPMDNYLPYINIKAFDKGIVTEYAESGSSVLVYPNEILMVWDGNCGYVGVSPMIGAAGSTLMVIYPKGIDKQYLYHFLKSKYDYINSNHKGSVIPHVDPKIIWDIDIPIPPTLDDQKKIVEKLELLLSRVKKVNDKLVNIPTILKRFRQSVLISACTGKLTVDWREENVVGEWENNTLSELCSNIVDCPHSTPKWTADGKICIRTTNFKVGKLDLSEVRYVSDETFILRNTRLTPIANDILYSREGGILGIACQVPENTELCLGQRMMLLRTKEHILSKYVMNVLNSPLITDIVREKTGGTASPHLNVGDVKNFIIPTPTYQEQKEIVRRVDKLFALADKIEQRYTNSRTQLERAEKAIYAKAFQGELIKLSEK